MICSRIHNKRGATIVLFALCLVALIGIVALVVDLGMLYIARQRAQNVADAAVLAAMWKLPDTNAAETVAKDVVIANNSASGSGKWQFTDPPQIDFSAYKGIPAGNVIRVTGSVPVNFFFAGIFGKSSGSASATAVGVRTGVESMKGKLMPWALTSTSVWNPDGTAKLMPEENWGTVVHQQNGLLGPGNFGAIYYGNEKQKQHYENRLSGAAEPIDIDVLDVVSNRHGNVDKDTINGLNARFGGRNNLISLEEWKEQGMPSDCPQLVLLPIVEDPNGANNQTFKVLGFAAYFITYYEDNKNKEPIVQGSFLSGVTNGEVTHWSFNIPGGTSTLYEEVHLVE